MIVYILTNIENQANRCGYDSILLQHNTHLHIFDTMKNMELARQSKVVDGFNILTNMINNKETVKQLLKDGMVECIELQINEIYLAQLVDDKITKADFLRLDVLLSFIHKLSKKEQIDMRTIIAMTVTVKMIKIINQSELYETALKENMICTFLCFITNIFLYHQSYIDYLFCRIVNNDGAILHLLLNYVKYDDAAIRQQCLCVLNRGISEYQKLINGIKQRQHKIFIQQNMMHAIKQILSESIDKGDAEMIITIKHVFLSGAVNYHLILDDDILNFIINSLNFEYNCHPHYSNLINSFNLISIIFQTMDASDIIKRLFNFKQGVIIEKISIIYSNFQLIPQDYKHYFFLLFKYLKNIILMEYIEEKYLKQKFIQFNFVNSLIKSQIILIDQDDKKIINNQLLNSCCISNDFDSLKLDMLFLISLLNSTFNPTHERLISEEAKDNHIFRIRPKIFDIILSDSSIEGCTKQYIFDHKLLSSESQYHIAMTLNIMIDKYELFTTIDDQHYQIVDDVDNEL